MGPRNKCGDDNLRDSFLKLAPMGSSPGQAFGDNIMLQIINFDHVYDFGLIQSKIIVN